MVLSQSMNLGPKSVLRLCVFSCFFWYGTTAFANCLNSEDDQLRPHWMNPGLPCLNRPWICCLCQDLWNKARLQDPSRGVEGLQLLRSKLAGRTKELSPWARLRTTTICTRMMGIGPRYAAGGFCGTWNNLLQFRVIGISTPWGQGQKIKGPTGKIALVADVVPGFVIATNLHLDWIQMTACGYFTGQRQLLATWVEKWHPNAEVMNALVLGISSDVHPNHDVWLVPRLKRRWSLRQSKQNNAEKQHRSHVVEAAETGFLYIISWCAKRCLPTIQVFNYFFLAFYSLEFLIKIALQLGIEIPSWLLWWITTSTKIFRRQA